MPPAPATSVEAGQHSGVAGQGVAVVSYRLAGKAEIENRILAAALYRDAMLIGVESLRQHKVYLESLGPGAAANTFDFLTVHAVASGRASSCEHAIFTELALINEPWG